jgi:hypothetical protein
MTTFRNNIWQSSVAFIYDGTDTRTFAEFAAMDLVDAGGNIDEVDPELTDPDNADYALDPTSPARRAGTGAGVFFGHDGVAFDASNPDVGAASATTTSSVVWPASLPQTVDQESYSEGLADVVERSEMDTGPAKVRRRFTSGIQVFQGTVTLTVAQMATLQTFFDSTLQGGSLAFQWVHQRTGAVAKMRFLAPPQTSQPGPQHFVATLALEILP